MAAGCTTLFSPTASWRTANEVPHRRLPRALHHGADRASLVATVRVVVHYDPSFSRPGTWILAPEGGGIRARFKLGDAPELVVDAPLHWQRTRCDGSTYAHPVDDSTWLTESSRFDGQVGVPIVLQLNDATEFAAESLRQL